MAGNGRESTKIGNRPPRFAILAVILGLFPNSWLWARISLTPSSQPTSHSEVPPMMGHKSVEPKLYMSFSLEAAVPANHLVRRLAAVVDFDFVRGPGAS